MGSKSYVESSCQWQRIAYFDCGFNELGVAEVCWLKLERISISSLLLETGALGSPYVRGYWPFHIHTKEDMMLEGQ